MAPSLCSLFLSESIKRRMHIAPSDAELLSFLSPHLPPHLVPFSLRQRCLADLLNQRPTRSQLLARGILRATLGHHQATEIAEVRADESLWFLTLRAEFKEERGGKGEGGEVVCGLTKAIPPHSIWRHGGGRIGMYAYMNQP